jgi:hypothetical protein
MAQPLTLTPQQRSQRARIAAHALHSQVDSTKHTEPARAAGPGRVEYFFDKVDPDRTLPDQERLRRAESARRSYFTRLSYKAARARSANAAG